VEGVAGHPLRCGAGGPAADAANGCYTTVFPDGLLLLRSDHRAMLVVGENRTIARRDVTLFELQTKGYRLTTAEIIYRMPDHPALLQTFIWQKFDLAPEFPELNKFLEFWRGNIEGRLHSVNVKQSSRTAPNRFRHVKRQLTLH
jgi:uncharacterized protein Usg